MITRDGFSSCRDKAGISLLEVLISIGVLSIGLLSVLALIPAGRMYLKKAAVDDRAAVLVPNAYATMRTLGLFTVNSLSWKNDSKTHEHPEDKLVIREVDGAGSSLDPQGRTVDAGWSIKTIDTQVIKEFHVKDAPFAQIQGTVPPVPVTNPPTTAGRDVTIDTNPNSGVNGTVQSVAATGAWSYPVPTTPHPFDAPDMEIHQSGTAVGKVSNQPYRDYTLRATYSGTAGIASANPNPASYRQYGRRRKEDDRTGRAMITYTRPNNADDSNATPGTAYKLPVPSIENATFQGRGEIARERSLEVLATLWRMELGPRHGIYTRKIDFDNINNAPEQLRDPVYPHEDITKSVGFSWLDGSGSEVPPSSTASPPVPETIEDVDWYEIEVDAAEVLTISWTDPTGVLHKEANHEFPIYLNTKSPSPAAMLRPFQILSGANSEKYSIPNDGYVITRAMLKPLTDPDSEAGRNGDVPRLLNTFGPVGVPRADRRNPDYTLTVTRTRTDRVVVVDPLMATRLDKIIELNGGAGRLDPYYLRRHRFADFQQTFGATGAPRAFVIPRLNWRKFTAGDTDTMLAMAEKLFRDQDNLAIDLPATEDDAPEPRFDLDAASLPVRRQAEGRMSWLLMIQPEDPGPVSVNWTAGRYFDVSMVVFEDRKLPPVTAGPALEGEYAFNAQWSDIDGMVTLTVPPTGLTAELDEEDVRDLFRTGAWLLLAPRTTYDASPLDSTQRLDWVRIQSSRIERQAGGGFNVGVLLETEPADTILYRAQRTTPNISPLVVLGYHGVVAVVNKTMRLEP